MQRISSLILALFFFGGITPVVFSQTSSNPALAGENLSKQAPNKKKSRGLHPSKVLVTPLLMRGADDETKRLIDVLPLFKISNDSVIQPIDLSADYPGMVLKAWNIKLPKDSFTQGVTHAYGYVPHHHGVGELPDYTLILVDNPLGMRHRSTRIWVDLNHNFDLTDDGSAQIYLPMKLQLSKLYDGDRRYSESLVRLDTVKNGMAVGLNQFMPNELKSVQTMYDDAIGLICGRREYLGCNLSFRQHRKSVWYGVEKINTGAQSDSLYWAIKDVNLNGSYNDIGIDQVMIGNVRGEFNNNNAWDYQPGGVVDWLGQAQMIDYVSCNQEGVWVIAHRKINNSGIKHSRSLLVGQKFPKFKFCLIEGKYSPGKLKENPVHRRSIRKFKGKYTYIVVWNADNANFIHDSAELHDLSRNLPDSLQIVCLNHGGGGRYVYQYNKRYDSHLIQGFCSPEVAEKLKLQTMPQYFLVDERQRLISINQRPSTLKKR